MDGAWTECAAPVEVCDGVDNDCDGVTDDGFAVGEACEEGLGECARPGTTVCAPDGESVLCAIAVGGRIIGPAEPAEVCDGLDNDCDGVTDEGLGGEACMAGVGACARDGLTICRDGATVCDGPLGLAAEEVCDGIDNDCDGASDEALRCVACGDGELDPDEECDDGNLAPGDGCDGLCANEADVEVGNYMLCGNSARNAATFVPQLEFVAGCEPDAMTRALLVSRSGVVDGETLQAFLARGGAVITEYSSADEVWNAALPDVPVQQSPGQSGSCRDNINPAVRYSLDDPFWAEHAPLPQQDPQESGCGFDLRAFPGLVPLGGHTVEPVVNLGYRDVGAGRLWLVEGDWQDNQAGPLDWNLASQQLMRSMILSGQLGEAPAERNYMLCGQAQRDVATFEPNLNFVAGCEPDANTVALLVSRSGNVDGAVAQAFLDRGGNLITEYSRTDDVWNAVFPEQPVVQAGAQNGGCRDNINPAVRYNEEDPFWQANGDLPLEPVAQTGCGFDLQAYPDIVALGSNTVAPLVNLAYRDVGAGRFWLVEGDWQDLDGGDAFGPPSQTLMRHMINHAGESLIEGVQQDVSEAEIRNRGWAECFRGTYAEQNLSGESLQTLLADCAGAQLLLACRPVGADNFTVAAEGAFADVTFDTNQQNVPHVHNGVGWYFSDFHAWGFAPEGLPIQLGPCDTAQQGGAERRMCWHTLANDGGWSCGATRGLNNNAEWERMVFSR